MVDVTKAPSNDYSGEEECVAAFVGCMFLNVTLRKCHQ